MGRENSSADWLPKGWKVQVKIRKTGKKDKCYVDPSNERKFFSKLEVLRYLKNAGINHSVCEEIETKSTRRPAADKVVVKEAITEGLPTGWIKETRVTQKGKKIRRDAYYIDPVSGHIFRSMKEVFHYLETGKTRRQTSKTKEQGLNNLESGQDSLSLAAETEEKMRANRKAGKQLIGNQSLITDTGVMNNDSLPEAGKLEQEKKEIPLDGGSPAADVPQENLQEGNGLEETKGKSKKRKQVKGAELPRRISKRLAGIEVDLSMEPTLPTRVRRAAGRQASEAEMTCADKRENLSNLDEDAKRLSCAENKADVKPEEESLDVLPPGDITAQEEHAKLGITAECNGDDQKVEVPIELPFSELWNDPCIEFAIKTLTGGMPIGDENKVSVMNQGSSSNLPNVVVAAANPRQDLPSTDIWADPCFEFAVKTLTSDLPVENDPVVEAMLKQPTHSSSQTVGNNGSTLPSTRSGVSFAHSNVAADTPQQKQQL